MPNDSSVCRTRILCDQEDERLPAHAGQWGTYRLGSNAAMAEVRHAQRGSMHPAFIGIDLAVAKRKRLPVVICTWQDRQLVPFPLRRLDLKPPRGPGNVACMDAGAIERFADQAAEYVRRACRQLGLTPIRIAIDAPRVPRGDERPRRAAEAAMDAAGISCFATPSASQFDAIRSKVALHLEAGGAEARLPHANQLWMLAGFALFRRLAEVAQCIEVYPQAIARSLGAGGIQQGRRRGRRRAAQRGVSPYRMAHPWRRHQPPEIGRMGAAARLLGRVPVGVGRGPRGEGARAARDPAERRHLDAAFGVSGSCRSAPGGVSGRSLRLALDVVSPRHRHRRVPFPANPVLYR